MAEIEIKDYTKSEEYQSLNKSNKMAVDIMMKNLKNDNLIWKQGWRTQAPINIRGTRYKGDNNLLLTLVAMDRGYEDNRWITYNQMQEKGWAFKTDENGVSLGKKAGVPVMYYELRDRETKKPFDRSVLDGMTEDEREDYMHKNVYPLRKTYTVFNGSIIDGIPEKKPLLIDDTRRNERVERLLNYWSNKEAKIVYGGSIAAYSPKKDEIHLPNRSEFNSYGEFYGTALHETAHSTGHEKRLNRNLSTSFGGKEYAQEELRAEIASMFLAQEYGINVDNDKLINNNAAYVKSWIKGLEDNPNALITAVADANKISKYVIDKEKANIKEVEPYTITQEVNEDGEIVYGILINDEKGQTKNAFEQKFTTKEALNEEFAKMQDLPYYGNKEFIEVSLDELKVRGEERAAMNNVEMQQSDVYIQPSEAAAKAAAENIDRVDMAAEDKGIESLTSMSDRELVNRAKRSKSGDSFKMLYDGESLYHNEERDERSLMTRICMLTSDKNQAMRVFKSSGQFRADKPIEHYETMLEQQTKFADRIKSTRKTQTADKQKPDNKKQQTYAKS